jgi:type IV pilus assembly protein PilE
MPRRDRDVHGHGKDGFTLIELLAALAILGILITIAFPSYHDMVRKSRRTDATMELFRIQLEQERYRATHQHYAEGLTALGWPTEEVDSPAGHYRITLEAVVDPMTAFRARATPRTGTDQVHDACGTLTIDQNGPGLDDPEQAGCWPR